MKKNGQRLKLKKQGEEAAIKIGTEGKEINGATKINNTHKRKKERKV